MVVVWIPLLFCPKKKKTILLLVFYFCGRGVVKVSRVLAGFAGGGVVVGDGGRAVPCSARLVHRSHLCFARLMHRCRPCCACLCPPLSPLLRSLHPHLRLSPPASQFVCCPRLVRCCLRLRQFVWSPSPVALCPPHILIQVSLLLSLCRPLLHLSYLNLSFLSP